MALKNVLFPSLYFAFCTLCTCKVSAGLTSFFYVAKLFKQSGIADVKFVRNINAKQEIFTNSADVKNTSRCISTDVREDVFFILSEYSSEK